jgi:hypothetical protein
MSARVLLFLSRPQHRATLSPDARQRFCRPNEWFAARMHAGLRVGVWERHRRRRPPTARQLKANRLRLKARMDDLEGD